ncbi:MAG: ATP-binding protein [Chloroflexi bacterium]|nr:ATP-binding protein [Chloroflexota bacterium]
MSWDRFDRELSGARRIALVGREEILQNIKEFSRKHSRPALIYLEGDGGIGKTAVLEEVRSQLAEDRQSIVAASLIDLYHLEYQTPQGLAEAISDVFPQEQVRFRAFHARHRKTLEALRLRQLEEANKAWKRAEEALIQALNSMADKKYIWLFLDTAEVLSTIAGDDEMDIGWMGPFDPSGASIARWLRDRILPALRNRVVVIMAGRPSQLDRDLIQPLRKTHWRVEGPLELEPLSLQHCKEYLEQVAHQVDEDGDRAGAENIRRYLATYGEIPVHRETAGQPLRMAMVADILRAGGSLPSGFYDPEGHGRTDQASLDQALIRHLANLETPLGATIQHMASLDKGANADLLAEILRIEPEEAQKYLDAATKLTLVKVRPGNVRRPYFLHDEIYTLFARYLPPKREEELFGRIIAYYEREMEDLRRNMSEYPVLFTEFQVQHRMAQVERVHYTTWLFPLRGYAAYFEDSCESILSREPSWYQLLRNEFRRTKEKLEELGRSPEKLSELSTYLKWDESLRRAEIALHWLNDIKKAEQLLSQISGSRQMPSLCQAHRHFLQATILIRKGNLSPAEEALNQSAVALTKVSDGGLELATQTLQALIYNYQGYIRRLRGNYREAIPYYQRAAALMRQLGLGGISGVLTNQAYAMTMMGYERHGRETAKEALNYAVRNHSVYDQVRALNVRAILETRAGDPEKGLSFAEEALELLREYPDHRLEGLVRITMARALRYQWNEEVSEALSQWRARWHEVLPRALAHLEGSEYTGERLGIFLLKEEIKAGAIELLRGTPDRESWVSALNESGCLWREVAWVTRDSDKEKNRTAHQRAEGRLLQASGIERRKSGWFPQVRTQINQIGGSPFWPTLALTNLGWHYHYQRERPEKIEEICALVEQAIGEDYLWQPDYPPIIETNRAELMLWVVLGKMEMLRCYEQLRGEWRADPEAVKRAAWHATLSLEYNCLIGQPSYDLRRAEIGLENRLRRSRNWERELLPAFYESALKAEEELKKTVPEDHPLRGRQTRLIRWLNERFGPPELWVSDNSRGA